MPLLHQLIHIDKRLSEVILMLENHYVYNKEVDWSLLKEGINTPIGIQVVLKENIPNLFKRGHSQLISLVLDGKTYKAKLGNQKFNETKYSARKDILQIRYSSQSELAVKLRSVFYKSYNYISEQRNIQVGNSRINVKLPEENKEYLAIYTTEYPDTFLLECITDIEVLAAKNYYINESEEEYEASINYNVIDPYATTQTVLKMSKNRKLNKAIGENLKMHYDYRCQICGDNFGDKYGTRIVETHHIEPFVLSFNNDASNQIIICPNHHRVIHKTVPALDRRKMLFIYSNGIQEKVLINKHL